MLSLCYTSRLILCEVGYGKTILKYGKYHLGELRAQCINRKKISLQENLKVFYKEQP
jgi:hypothetical protein